MDQVTIQLTERDAELFILFQQQYVLFQKFLKYQPTMIALDTIDAFDICNGSIEIHFDSNKHVASIDKHQHFRT